MTIETLNKVMARNPQLRSYLSTDYAAKKLAEATGCEFHRHGQRVIIEAEDAMAECYWMNRKHTMMGVREASC